MDQPLSHLILYDGKCGLCDHVVQIILKADKHHLFVFAPLQGETAARFIKQLPPEDQKVDSLILVENYQTSYAHVSLLSQGVLRIAWLLGGAWTLIGWLAFLPSALFNGVYRFVARNRHRWFPPPNDCRVPTPEEKKRFLP